MTRAALFGLALLAAASATPLWAADVATVIAQRHDHFKAIGKAAKGLGDELKTSAPSMPKIQDYAKQIDALALQVPSWFPEGSGPESGQKTHAKAAIWRQPDEFKKDASAFVEAAHKLNAIASMGDIAGVKVQMAAVGQTCKTCHQAFREKDD
jgi:cytochrome c556